MLPERTEWTCDLAEVGARIEEVVGSDLWPRLWTMLPSGSHAQGGLIATSAARDVPLLLQADLNAVRDAPVGYGLTGFWGHGINSYAFYFQTVTAERRLFVRLPYGGAFMDDSQCQDDIREFLAALLDFQSLDLSRRDVLIAVESVGWGYYQLATPTGRVYELRDSLAGTKDVRERLRSLDATVNRVVEDKSDAAIWTLSAFWGVMEQPTGGFPLVQRFVDDDTLYRTWIDHNPSGFVLNTERVAKAGYLVLHRADCLHITGYLRANPTSTDYGKTCGTTVADLRRWASRETGGEPRACRACDPLDQRVKTRPEGD